MDKLTERKINLPDFLVVGAAKAGTTSLYHCLLQHPQIYVSGDIKETCYWVRDKEIMGNGRGYFEKDFVTERKRYERLFAKADSRIHKAIGEVCNAYLYYYENTIPNILENLGDIKIIIILRNPGDRAYSGYLHLMRDGAVNETFTECMEREDFRIKDNWWWGFHIVNIGFYYGAVKAYLDNFSQVKIMLYDEFVNNPPEFIQSIYNFLEVDSSFVPDTNTRYNVTGVHKNKFARWFITDQGIAKRISRSIVKFILPACIWSKISGRVRDYLLSRPEIKEEEKNRLKLVYKDEIYKLAGLINKDLLFWLE